MMWMRWKMMTNKRGWDVTLWGKFQEHNYEADEQYYNKKHRIDSRLILLLNFFVHIFSYRCRFRNPIKLLGVLMHYPPPHRTYNLSGSGAYLAMGQWGQLSPPREKEKGKNKERRRRSGSFFWICPHQNVFFWKLEIEIFGSTKGVWGGLEP